MRKTQLFHHLYLATITASNCGGGPFTNAIDRQNRRFRKWRRKETAGCVRSMMCREEDRAVASQSSNFGANSPSQIELFAEPSGQDTRKGRQPARSYREVTFEHPRELRDWLIVEDDCIDVAGLES